MNVSTKVKGAKKVEDFLETKKNNIIKGIERDLILSAKRLAFYLAENATIPISGGDGSGFNKLSQRITSNVKRVYPSVGDPGWVGAAYAILKNSGNDKVAKKFWINHLKNEGQGVRGDRSVEKRSLGFSPSSAQLTDEAYFAKIRTTGIRKIDDKQYKGRLESHGTFNKKTFTLMSKTPPLAMVKPGEAERYAKVRMKKMGLAKAAWYQAVFDLKGQRNYAKSKSEEGKFVWPKLMPKLSSANPGIGSNTIIVSRTQCKIILTNHLSYTGHACPADLVALAKVYAIKAMEILLSHRAKAKEIAGKTNPSIE